MASLFLGYDVAQTKRRTRLRRAIHQYLPALHQSALQGVASTADSRLLLHEALQHFDPDTDGLLLARLLPPNAHTTRYQLRPNANTTQPGLILLS